MQTAAIEVSREGIYWTPKQVCSDLNA